MLVGAVGIENNAGWNFKELEEMQHNAKTLKRNSEESNGILIGPSMAPHFVKFLKIPAPWLFSPISLRRTSAPAQILRHEWQADLPRLQNTEQ
jgi:hypothetical protein